MSFMNNLLLYYNLLRSTVRHNIIRHGRFNMDIDTVTRELQSHSLAVYYEYHPNMTRGCP